MIKAWFRNNQKINIASIRKNDKGSTMAEVLVGFLLLMILIESLVGLIGLSRDMLMKSKDMLDAQTNLQSEFYKTGHGNLNVSDVPGSFEMYQTDKEGNSLGLESISLPHAKLKCVEEKDDTDNKVGIKVYILDYE